MHKNLWACSENSSELDAELLKLFTSTREIEFNTNRNLSVESLLHEQPAHSNAAAAFNFVETDMARQTSSVALLVVAAICSMVCSSSAAKPFLMHVAWGEYTVACACAWTVAARGV